MFFAFLLFLMGLTLIIIGLKCLKLAKGTNIYDEKAPIWWGQNPIVLYIIYIIVMFGLSLMCFGISLFFNDRYFL